MLSQEAAQAKSVSEINYREIFGFKPCHRKSIIRSVIS